MAAKYICYTTSVSCFLHCLLPVLSLWKLAEAKEQEGGCFQIILSIVC